MHALQDGETPAAVACQLPQLEVLVWLVEECKVDIDWFDDVSVFPGVRAWCDARLALIVYWY